MPTLQQPKLKHFNDGDEWMVAEEIPDIDFFFCQIWLRSFVNDLSNSCGRNYSKVLGVFRGKDMKFHYGNRDCRELTLHLVNGIRADPSFGEKINEEIVKRSDELEAFSRKIGDIDYKNAGNAELNEIIQEHVRIHTRLYEWGWLSNATDMFYPEYTELLKRILRPHAKDDAEVNALFVALTNPDENSKEAEQHEELLGIAIEIENDAKQKKLFLEGPTSRIEKEAGRKILRKIDAYSKKFGVMGALWVYEPFGTAHFLEELCNFFREGKSAAQELERLDGASKARKLEKQALFEKFGLAVKERRLFTIYSNFMLTKFYRRYAQIRSLYSLRAIFREIARRFGISFQQARFLLAPEYEELLVRGSFDLRQLREREKLCVLYSEKGADRIFVGREAEKLAREAEPKLRADVVEIKGQTACLGKAKGAAKIILSASDLHKMRKGDVLVAIATNPDVVPAMKKAAAIVTEQGGVTCHAAIVSRELNIPCVIGTKIATKWLKDGDLVEVDATNGLVRKVK